MEICGYAPVPYFLSNISMTSHSHLHLCILRYLRIMMQHLHLKSLIYYCATTLLISEVVTRTYRLIFIYLTRCTNTGVIVTHALSFYRPLAPLFVLTRAQLAVVTQSCALLYTAAHCDLLLQWRYCSSDAYCSRYLIVLLRYISQACWVLCSPRLDFFHSTVIRYIGSSQ